MTENVVVLSSLPSATSIVERWSYTTPFSRDMVVLLCVFPLKIEEISVPGWGLLLATMERMGCICNSYCMR